MTKRNLLLVSLLVALGLAAAAPSLFAAQGTTWTYGNNENYFARNEGDAEGVGTITLSATGTGTVAASTYIYIDYNAEIAQNSAGYAVSVTFGGDDATTLDGCVTVSIGTYLGDLTPGPPTSVKLVNNEIVLAFTCTGGEPIDATDTINVVTRVMIEGFTNDYVVTANLRAQYYNTGFPLTISGRSNYPQSIPLAEIEGGETATYLTATNITFYKGPAYVLTCIGIKDIPGTSLDNDFILNIAENWPNALTSLSDEISLEHDSLPNDKGISVAGAPTNGSNILIILYHIPPGVGVVADTPYPCEDFDTSSAMYCSGGLLDIDSPVSVSMPNGSDGLGVEGFWYQVLATNVGVIENAGFPFHLWSDGPLAPNKGYGITAQVFLTDLNPSNTPTDMPYFTSPEDTPVLVVDFIDCRTNILFPYINTYQGGKSAFSSFGTGVIITNTTADPFASLNAAGNYVYPDMQKGAAIPQSGNCTIYAYPDNQGNPSVYMTPVISSGGMASIDMGSGNGSFDGVSGAVALAPGTTLFSATQGYAIAVCNFQNAHGFAEIYDNYVNLATSGPTATLGYLADVLPDPAFYRRSPAGDGLGETAIAPININHFLLKLLMKCGYNSDCFEIDGATTTPSTSSSVKVK